MEFAQVNKQLRNARLQRNSVFFFLVVMIFVNIALVSTISRTTRTTVLIPSRVSDGMVAAGAMDQRYVEGLALDAVYSIYNTSPETTASGRQVVERLASVRDRAKLLQEYDEVAKDITERRISTRFERYRIEFDTNTLIMRVTGRLTTYVETEVVNVAERVVILRFVEEASSVRLAAMSIEEAEV